MNTKHFLGKTLQLVGSPSAFGLMNCFSAITSDNKMGHLLWAVPLTVSTLPLLPLWIIGDGMIREEETVVFTQRTKDLPKVNLPKNFMYITEINGKWRVEPLCMDGDEDPFESEFEARQFLEALAYHEVLSVDCQDRQTFWIK